MLLVVAGVVALACKPVSFYRRPPSLRGVGVPLPPPSFRAGQRISVRVEGVLPLSSSHPQTFVYLWEDLDQSGYFVRPDADTGEFLFEDVQVTVGESCLDTHYVDGLDDEDSGIAYYKVELRTEPDICEQPNCSAPDTIGACVCLVKWGSGC
ncbi:MAG: hypothetical protein V3V08_06670 [Nannocystaceae bacterium]